MRRQFEMTGIEEADLSQVIALQIECLRDAAADGVVLLATHGQGESKAGIPPPGLSLTLALANRPVSGTAGEGPTSGEGASTRERSGEAAKFVSDAAPFVLANPEVSAFTRETRAEVSVPGADKPFARLQSQAFVLPKDHAGMAVITVTTFHPDCEEAAREMARNFANTLCFVTADGDDKAGMAP